MGFLKDLSAIKKQTRAMEANSDPGARFAEMNTKLGALNASMAQQTAVLTAAPGDAVAGSVQIVSATPTKASVNGACVVDLSVLVLSAGRPPIPVTSSVIVPATYLHLASAGATLPAQLSAADPTGFAIDWSAAARP